MIDEIVGQLLANIAQVFNSLTEGTNEELNFSKFQLLHRWPGGGGGGF